MKKHKFQPGATIDSIDQLVRLLEGGRWIYLHHKPLHPGFVRGWSIHYALIAIHGKFLRVADEVSHEQP